MTPQRRVNRATIGAQATLWTQSSIRATLRWSPSVKSWCVLTCLFLQHSCDVDLLHVTVPHCDSSYFLISFPSRLFYCAAAVCHSVRSFCLSVCPSDHISLLADDKQRHSGWNVLLTVPRPHTVTHHSSRLIRPLDGSTHQYRNLRFEIHSQVFSKTYTDRLQKLHI